MTRHDEVDPAQLDDLTKWWAMEFEEHGAGLRSYLSALRGAPDGAVSDTVREAAAGVRRGIRFLAHSQPRDPAIGFIGWRDRIEPTDDSFDEMPVWNEPDPPLATSATELPGVVAFNQVLAEGEWGSILLAEALVYSDSVEFVVDRVQLRNGQALDVWASRDTPLEGEWEPAGPQPATVWGAASAIAEFTGGDSASNHRGARRATVRYLVAGAFTSDVVVVRLPVDDPDAGKVEFEVETAVLDAARSNIVAVVA